MLFFDNAMIDPAEVVAVLFEPRDPTNPNPTPSLTLVLRGNSTHMRFMNATAIREIQAALRRHFEAPGETKV